VMSIHSSVVVLVNASHYVNDVMVSLTAKTRVMSSTAVCYVLFHCTCSIINDVVSTEQHYASRYKLSSCVRLTVTSRICTETTKCRITLIMPRDSSLLVPKMLAKFKWGHTNGGAKCRWGK